MAALLLILGVLAFVASTLVYALQPGAGVDPSLGPGPWQAGSQGPPPVPVDLPALFLRPRGLGMGGLLAAVWAALAYHAGRRWSEGRQARAAAALGVKQGPVQNHKRGAGGAEALPLTLGLLAGAAWPWLWPGQPFYAFLLSAAMLSGFLVAAMRDIRVGGHVRRSSSLGFVAGWGLLACLAVLTGVLRDRLGLPQEGAAIAALLIGSVAAVWVQLRLERRIGFSLALIWGLIGVAASTVTTDAAIATMTVIAIAIVAVALVRVMT